MESNKCEQTEKLTSIVLIPETPFEKGMSISTWEKKRIENAQKILDNFKQNVKNGTAIVLK